MDGKELDELRELVEFLKANGIGEFDMERADLKVRIKFAGEGGASGADMAQLARLMGGDSQPGGACCCSGGCCSGCRRRGRGGAA